jgi:hypothetical protein
MLFELEDGFVSQLGDSSFARHEPGLIVKPMR